MFTLYRPHPHCRAIGGRAGRDLSRPSARVAARRSATSVCGGAYAARVRPYTDTGFSRVPSSEITTCWLVTICVAASCVDASRSTRSVVTRRDRTDWSPSKPLTLGTTAAGQVRARCRFDHARSCRVRVRLHARGSAPDRRADRRPCHHRASRISDIVSRGRVRDAANPACPSSA